MLEKLRAAQRDRDALAARVGRVSAREALDGAEDLFAELDRMAERILDEERRADAAGDVLDLHEEPPDPAAADPEADAEARLRDLRRRLGRD